MSLPVENTAPVQSQNHGFVRRLEVELEDSWRERRYAAFMRAWITSIALTAAVGFVVPLIMIGVYSFIAFVIIGSEGRGTPNIWSVCLWIGGLAGTTTLLFTIPIMAMRTLQPSPSHRN